jgi:hypothetical protein
MLLLFLMYVNTILFRHPCHPLARKREVIDGRYRFLAKLRLKPTSCEEHGYLFSGMKKWIRTSQLMARVKAGGKALENLPATSPS